MAKIAKSKYTVDDVPVKNIMNGVIVLDNNQKVTGVKIMPRNIFILDQQTQNAIMNFGLLLLINLLILILIYHNYKFYILIPVIQ